jgi:large subunit ribosomal protein L3
MQGQMGNERVTKKNLMVVDVRAEENVLLVKGAVPGAKEGLLQIYTK